MHEATRNTKNVKILIARKNWRGNCGSGASNGVRDIFPLFEIPLSSFTSWRNPTHILRLLLWEPFLNPQVVTCSPLCSHSLSHTHNSLWNLPHSPSTWKLNLELLHPLPYSHYLKSHLLPEHCTYNISQFYCYERSVKCLVLVTSYWWPTSLLMAMVLNHSASALCSWPDAFHLARAQLVFLTIRATEMKFRLKICPLLKNRSRHSTHIPLSTISSGSLFPL